MYLQQANQDEVGIGQDAMNPTRLTQPLHQDTAPHIHAHTSHPWNVPPKHTDLQYLHWSRGYAGFEHFVPAIQAPNRIRSNRNPRGHTHRRAPASPLQVESTPSMMKSHPTMLRESQLGCLCLRNICAS